MPYQTYQSPFAARTARQTTGFREPTAFKPMQTVFSQPVYGTSQVPGYPAGVTNNNLAQTLFGGVGDNGTPGANPAKPSVSPLYDPSTDPYYQQIKALGTRSQANAVSGADRLRKTALINLGDPTFAHQQQFGDPSNPTYGDQSTELAAAQNPDSLLNQLLRAHSQTTAGIDQGANQAGLYYSSTHANQLGDEATRYRQQQNDARSNVAGQLGSILDQVLQAKTTADQNNITALGTSTQNAINAALQNGYSFGGYDANGKPILTKPAEASGAGSGTGTGSGTGAASGGDASGGGGIATENAYPGIIDAILSPLANAARQRGQRGEYLSLNG